MIFVVAGLVSALLCLLVHYETLRFLSAQVTKPPRAPRQRIVAIMIGIFVSHLIEVGIFALGLWASMTMSGRQLFNRDIEHNFLEALYISFESYASLGSAEVFSFGPARLFCGIEAVSGLLLIGWTTAFTYWAMTELWREH